MTRLILGQTLAFDADPFSTPPEDAARHSAHGAILMDGDRIAAVGEADALRAAHPDAQVEDMGDALLVPGFVDCHAHYPQTAIIASWGRRLIDWLNNYTFPEESRFGDGAYARTQAELYLDLCLANGITSARVFSTIHPESVDAIFEAAQARNMRLVTGKVMMDRNAIDGLKDTAQSGYDDSKALLEKWRGVGRLGYAVTILVPEGWTP